MASIGHGPYDTRRLQRLSRTILLMGLLLTAVARAELTATLVTVGPGDEVWEKFGHNMIRISDPDRGFDACYNWGLFDFDQPGFIANFVRGRMLYSMDALRTGPVLDLYRGQDRRVTEQRLLLSPTQLRELVIRCETNRQPGQRDYRYDYFKDNCSTRVRDMIDGVADGAIGRAARGREIAPAITYRSQMTRLMGGDFWLSLGADFTAGPATDRPLDVWADCFLPERVAEATMTAGVAGPPSELWTTKRLPEAAGPPTRWPGLFAAGLGFGGAILLLARWQTWAGRTAAILWWTVSGCGGAFLAFMWLATDHAATHANQNLLHYSPLAWGVIALLVVRQRRSAVRLAVVIGVVSILGGALRLAGVLGQQNAGFILLALPVNLAAARALTSPPPADEVADDEKGLVGSGGGGVDGDGGVRGQ